MTTPRRPPSRARTPTPKARGKRASRTPEWFRKAWKELQNPNWKMRDETLVNVAEHHPGQRATALFIHGARDSEMLVRHTALNLLSRTNDPRVAPVAIQNLADPEPIVHAAAARILGRLDTPKARAALMNAFVKVDARFADVARALAATASAPAAGLLASRVNHPDVQRPSDRFALVSALAECRHPTAKKALTHTLAYNHVVDPHVQTSLKLDPANAPIVLPFFQLPGPGGFDRLRKERSRAAVQRILDTLHERSQTPEFANDVHARVLRVFYPHFLRSRVANPQLIEQDSVIKAALAFATKPDELARIERKRNAALVLKQLRAHTQRVK